MSRAESPGRWQDSSSHGLGTDPSLGEVLQQLVPTFKLCALQSMREVLRMPVIAGSGWVPVPEFSLTVEMGAAVGFTNAGWQCQCLVATEARMYKSLRPDLDVEIWIDGLGEAANTICGILQGRDEFKAAFGEMLQTPPVGLLDGRFRFRDWTVAGPVLSSNGSAAFFAFGVRHQKNAVRS
jgi:hypothetical protein